MTARRGNILLVVLLAIAAIAASGAVGFWWRQRQTTTTPIQTPIEEKKSLQPPDETANWKMYTNEKYGISFKYPDTLFINRDGVDSSSTRFWVENTHGLNNPSDVYVTTLAEKKYKGKGFHFPEIVFFIYKASLSPEEWLKQNGTELSIFEKTSIVNTYLYHSVKNKKLMTSGGLAAVQFENSETSTGGTRTLISNGKGVLVDVTNVTTGVGQISPQLYDQILSTFRFLK